MTRTPERRESVVDGVRLSYLEWGTAMAGRPSLLILHGLLAAAETFDRVVEALDDSLHIVAVDLPSNGHSDKCPRKDTTTQALAARMRQFSEQIGLVKPIVLGHSHGGLLAIRWAVTARETVSGLVLMAPAHPYEGYREEMVRFYLRPFGRTAARLIFPRIPRRMYLYFFKQMPGTRDHFDLEALEPYLHSLRQGEAVPYTLAVLTSWHDDMAALREDLERAPLECPVLVLWGKKDLVVPASTAPALLAHMPQSQLVLMEQAGHLPNEEAPGECAVAITGWLETAFAAAAR